MILYQILFAVLINNPAEYRNDIQRFLENKFIDCRKIEYEIISPVNHEFNKLEIDKSRKSKMSSGYFYLPVILKENENAKNSVLTLKVKLFKEVLVARRDINKNEYLSANDFDLELKDITTLRFQPIETEVLLNLFRSRIRISEKTVLIKNMIEPVPDIKVGDKIEALYSNNSVNINFPVTARTEGVAGELIRVKNDDNRIFKARILNNSMVKIVE